MQNLPLNTNSKKLRIFFISPQSFKVNKQGDNLTLEPRTAESRGKKGLAQNATRDTKFISGNSLLKVPSTRLFETQGFQLGWALGYNSICRLALMKRSPLKGGGQVSARLFYPLMFWRTFVFYTKFGRMEPGWN